MLSAVIVLVLLACLFLLLGFVFGKGKGQWLIAGYNTMSERERAKVDENKLLKLMSGSMFAFAGCMAVSVLGALLGSRSLVNAGFGLLTVGAVVLVILANTKTKK